MVYVENISLTLGERKLLDKIRPQNYQYTEYPFPKTRRIDADADILGFVKLSIIE